MRSRLPWKQIFLLLLCVVLKEKVMGKSRMRCEDVVCYNDSPCRITSDGNGTSTAECVCQQGWLGRTCQTQIHLSVTSVTMTTINLKVTGRSETDTKEFESNLSEYNSVNGTGYELQTADAPTQYLNYSIHYWEGNFSNKCNIVSMVMTSSVTVTGLRNDTDYTFCLITDETMLCNFDLVNRHDNISYCTTARTSDTEVSIVTHSVSTVVFYTVIVSCIVIVALSILMAVIVISIRKKYFTHLIGASKGNKRRQSKNNSTMDDSLTQETLLLTTPTTNQRICVNPPSSPGKHKNKLVNTKTRGYASFTAKDDQAIALSTVIEYVEDDRQSNDSFYDNQDNQQQTTFLRRDEPLA